jgi:hypothetical protein
MFSGNFVIFQTKIFFISILSDYRKVNELKNMVGNVECSVIGETRPAWAGFKTAEEGRAKICKFLWQKLKNKSNIKNI